MTVAWPSFLPIPLRQSHAYSPDDLVERSSMEGGPTRTRQKYSSGPTKFTIGFVLDIDSWPLFEGFYTYDLKNGAGEFYLPVNTGVGTVQRRAIFLAPPNYDTSSGAGFCSVTASVQIVESTSISQSDYAVLSTTPGFLYGEDVLDRVTNILYPEAL